MMMSLHSVCQPYTLRPTVCDQCPGFNCFDRQQTIFILKTVDENAAKDSLIIELENNNSVKEKENFSLRKKVENQREIIQNDSVTIIKKDSISHNKDLIIDNKDRIIKKIMIENKIAKWSTAGVTGLGILVGIFSLFKKG